MRRGADALKRVLESRHQYHRPDIGRAPPARATERATFEIGNRATP